MEQTNYCPVVLYTAPDGTTQLDVKLENETVWLSVSQMSVLFDKEASNIRRHVLNVFKDGELDRESNVHFLHVPFSDKPVPFYSLDVIISVGYRVKSQRGVQFRIWANKILKQYLIKGYAIDQRRLDHYNELKDVVKLMSRAIALQEKVTEEEFGDCREPYRRDGGHGQSGGKSDQSGESVTIETKKQNDNMKNYNRIAALFLCSLVCVASEAKDYVVTSPNGHLKATVSDGERVEWKITHDDVTVLAPSAIGIQTKTGNWGTKTRIQKARQRSIDETINAVAYKRAVVNDKCNELTLECNGEFNLIVRAYDDGCAYRLVSKSNKPLTVVSESPEFAFANDYKAFVPYVNDNRGGERYCYSFESYYDEQKLSAMYPDSIAITPLAVCLPDGMKAVVMETSVEDYPGMFLYRGQNTPANTLQSEFAPLPLETEVGGFDRLNLVPTKRADYIAQIQKKQALPWRLVLVTTADTELLDTDTPYCLAPACRLTDTSWIKPGKVAWDWWNDWNISGVDFHAGINTRTYKHYIDFAQKNGLEYIIVDEGWSSQEDLLQYSNDELSIPELVAYGKERNVGVILWTSWRNLIKDLDRNMSHYAAAGVKGFKIDFFDRDDYEVIHSSYEIAAAAAKQHLLVDYHGLKPSGVQRAYPNVVNFEGVKGLENCKWEPRDGNGPVHDMPRYDVSIPYLRMLPGPLDYTPGAMLNATRDHFFGNNSHPMSQGTRVHQMAMYTIFEAPLQMLADSPTHYEQNQECTTFIAAVPTTFDQTVPLAGEMGEYVAIARRKGNTWYVAAMNNWTERDLTIDLSQFLTTEMNMDSFADGINAQREATDYKHVSRKVSPTEKFTIHLAPAGGWTARFF